MAIGRQVSTNKMTRRSLKIRRPSNNRSDTLYRLSHVLRHPDPLLALAQAGRMHENHRIPCCNEAMTRILGASVWMRQWGSVGMGQGQTRMGQEGRAVVCGLPRCWCGKVPVCSWGWVVLGPERASSPRQPSSPCMILGMLQYMWIAFRPPRLVSRYVSIQTCCC